MNQKISQTINLRQTQELTLKPQMIQSLKMLALPLIELELALKNEIVQNPLLELSEEYDDENSYLEETGAEIKDPDGEMSETLDEVKELSEIFLLQTKAMNGVLVSVSAVRISPDMSIARVYLSVFPSEKSQEIVKNINDNMKSIRFELGTRVRHQLRIIPELKFFVDDSLDYVERIDELLKK